MKSNVLILNLFIAVLLAASTGCKDSHSTKSKYKWPEIDAKFDECVATLEQAYIQGASDSLINALTDSLRLYSSISSVGNDEKKQLENRLLYWRGKLAGRQGLPSEENAFLSSSLANTDSVKFPYDYKRIKLLILQRTPGLYQNGGSLVALKEAENFFEHYNDSLTLAAIYVNLGNMFREWGYNKEAGENFHKASEIYSILGIHEYSTKIKLNLANVLSETDKNKAVLILDSLREDSIAISSPDFYNLILRNSYILTGHLPYLQSAYRRIENNPGYYDEKILYITYLIDNYSKQDNLRLDSAKFYLDKGLTLLENSNNDLFKARFLFAASKACYLDGDMKKAYETLKQGNDLYVQLAEESERTHLDMSKQNINDAINEGREQLKRESDIHRARMVIVILSVVVIIAVTFIIIRTRMQHSREKHRQLEYEHDRNQLKLESVALAVQEKENTIAAIQKMINTMRVSNSIPSDTAREISNAIKIHISGEDERNMFQKVHEMIKPNFASNLRKEFPSLTDNNIRFLSYVAIGLSNREIARIMMINIQSVNNNRHRIKQKMNLGPEDNLDEIIRRFN